MTPTNQPGTGNVGGERTREHLTCLRPYLATFHHRRHSLALASLCLREASPALPYCLLTRHHSGFGPSADIKKSRRKAPLGEHRSTSPSRSKELAEGATVKKKRSRKDWKMRYWSTDKSVEKTRTKQGGRGQCLAFSLRSNEFAHLEENKNALYRSHPDNVYSSDPSFFRHLEQPLEPG